MGRSRATRHRRHARAGHPHDRHLHQLPDHLPAGVRRTRRLRRYRSGHLRQQRMRRAQQLRGRTGGRQRRADRTHATLRLPPGPPSTRHPPVRGRDAAGDAERLGRPRRDRRAGGQLLLAGAGDRRHRRRAHLRRAQALRRRARELRLGADVPHDRGHAGSTRPGQRLRRAAGADPPHRPGRPRRLPPILRPSRGRCRRRGVRGARSSRWSSCNGSAIFSAGGGCIRTPRC